MRCISVSTRLARAPIGRCTLQRAAHRRCRFASLGRVKITLGSSNIVVVVLYYYYYYYWWNIVMCSVFPSEGVVTPTSGGVSIVLHCSADRPTVRGTFLLIENVCWLIFAVPFLLFADTIGVGRLTILQIMCWCD
jgi:hypothetical protein